MIRASIDNASMDLLTKLPASLSEHELIHVADNIEIAETFSFNNNSRAQYKDTEKCKIAKYPSEHGVMKAVKKSKRIFRNCQRALFVHG